jgi:hypothetical protein
MPALTHAKRTGCSKALQELRWFKRQARLLVRLRLAAVVPNLQQRAGYVPCRHKTVPLGWFQSLISAKSERLAWANGLKGAVHAGLSARLNPSVDPLLAGRRGLLVFSG